MFGAVFKRVIPSLAAERYRWRHDGLIHCIEARRGKSFTMTEIIRWCVVHRYPVVTNIRSIDFYRLGLQMTQDGAFSMFVDALAWMQQNITFAKGWDDLLTAHDCFVVLDEVSRLFDAQAKKYGRGAPAVVEEFLQQSRKVRVTIWLATQSFEWVDKRVTQLVDLMWMARKENWKRRKDAEGRPVPKAFWLYALDPGGAGKSENVRRDHADFVIKVPFSLRTATLYNS
jgi:hypothetical protein